MSSPEEVRDVQRAAMQPFWDATGAGALPDVATTSDENVLAEPSAFRVGLCATASVAAVKAAVAELTNSAAEPVDPSLALASFTTKTIVNGTAPPKWAPLSGIYRTGDDRFVQLHCNFAHHAAGAAKVLGAAEDRPAFEAAIAERNAVELEAELIDAGMIGAALRSIDEWDTHPHAHAVRDLPIATVTALNEASPARPAGSTSAHGPLSGVRVLDCSRVLAGPVAGHTLANLGADVLRVGAEHLDHVELCVIATGAGKRNTNVDLRSAEGRATFTRLLQTADVMIDAFRPGALANYGFSAQNIADIAPSTSVVQVCAFDWVGPWAGRRGFDSIVQSTTGIGLAGMAMAGADQPTPLPVQALDYATGYFAAAAAIRAVHRARSGVGSTLSRLSLIRTRNWLLGLGEPRPFAPAAVTPLPTQMASIEGDMGTIEMVRPVVGQWQHGPRHLGTAEPVWL